ncbi:hypothetical protein F0562_007187 [Nyssa sinensis]|uniref:Disease resistance N-terminal domain-containing protein n=1 Tax=Nyssa sinensis TaxID=561372 RepID=A0A5J5A670_9ASTE|nr:hypothetical protein F0562_007187 [Nyssa sinensis]
MVVGEIILSAFIKVLFEKLSSGELLNFARREGIETQLKKLRNMLPDIRAVLSDAEDKQITNTSVKQWLDDLTDLAYDLDDVVDELATEVLRRKLMAEPQTSTIKLPRLRELIIHSCPKLMKVSLLRLPSLRKLSLQECNEVVLESVVDMTLLTELTLENIRELTYLHEEFMQFLVSLKVLHLENCDKLLNLWVTRENVKKEECLPRNLEVLNIFSCVNLEKLPNELNKLTALRELTITSCPKLVSFPETGVPPMLRSLETTMCEALEYLPNDISRLQQLELFSSACLPTGGKLPTTVKSFRICKGVHSESVSETILEEISTSLEYLIIEGFPNTRTLLGSVRNFKNLVDLTISTCDRLEWFPERGLSAPNLRYLEISDCPILKSMPDQIQSLTSLTQLFIFDCPILKSMPDQIQSLTSLRDLWIRNCPNLEFSHPKTKGDFPPNLIDLAISSCQKLKPLTEWGLHLLTSLRYVEINNVHAELVSFPDFPDNDEYYYRLPATLTSLSIGGLQNLESLSSKGLQNLTSLKMLYIKECPKLQSLPKDGLLATLSRLEIYDCPLLKQSLCLNYAKTPVVATMFITAALSLSSFSQAGFLPNMQET